MIDARSLVSFVLGAAFIATGICKADCSNHKRVATVVDAAIQSVMKNDAIPGMSVALIVDGKPYRFNYGLASIGSKVPVTDDTLFEIGSISKTFTATLASLAQVDGRLSLSDRVGKDFPSLEGSPFGDVTLINLGTHTPGGLPLQVPDGIANTDQLIQYLRAWHPTYPPGTYRTYSNISIGFLGLIAAKRFGEDFSALMERRVFRALSMSHTYIDIPHSKIADYAEGYREGSPVRLTPGVLWREAYGVKTNATDMLRYVQANMDVVTVEPALRTAIVGTHTGYFTAGPFTQDLIWEQYAVPVARKMLLEGNAPAMIFEPRPASALEPATKPRADVWINKTGSTNGFGAYVAFIPERRCGIVLLANENYPIADRVTTAYAILSSLCGINS